MMNPMEYTLADFGSDVLLGGSQLQDMKFQRTNEYVKLISQGVSPDQAEKILNTKMPITGRGMKAADTMGDGLRYLGGKEFANKAQWQLIEKLGGAKGQLKPGVMGKVARFAGGKTAHTLLRAVPGLSAGLVAFDVGDVLLGPDSAGNKVMDGTAMTIGGILGAAGGPVGVAAGIGAGKMVSDATQWLFGDKKTAEQRKLEEALARLNGGI